MSRQDQTGLVDDLGPVLDGPGASDYERYLRTDELLSLQKPPEELAHHDELLFQCTHQASELWLKLAGEEMELATEHLGRGEIRPALRLLDRVILCFKLSTQNLDMLELMSPWEYTAEVRPVLGHGSGFDSPGWNPSRASDAIATAFAATWLFMSSAPRPQTQPSFSSPDHGSTDHSSGSARTVSVCESSNRLGPSPRPGIRATRFARSGTRA